MAAATDVVGVMVLRAWRESNAEPVRVRVTQTPDLSAGEPGESAVVGPEEAVRLVREWLEAVGGADEAGEWTG